MSLKERNGIWRWRKIINGRPFNRSTKTGDKWEAERIAAVWEVLWQESPDLRNSQGPV